LLIFIFCLVLLVSSSFSPIVFSSDFLFARTERLTCWFSGIAFFAFHSSPFVLWLPLLLLMCLWRLLFLSFRSTFSSWFSFPVTNSMPSSTTRTEYIQMHFIDRSRRSSFIDGEGGYRSWVSFLPFRILMFIVDSNISFLPRIIHTSVSLLLPYPPRSTQAFCSANSGNNLTTTKSTIPTIKCLFI
jgi:hypothetical protein